MSEIPRNIRISAEVDTSVLFDVLASGGQDAQASLGCRLVELFLSGGQVGFIGKLGLAAYGITFDTTPPEREATTPDSGGKHGL